MNKEVTQYIEKQNSPKKEICKKLRRIILKTLPKIEEKKFMGVAWYGKFYIVSLKDSVNLGFSVKGLSKEETDNFNGSGKYMKHLKFKDTKEIDEKTIVKLIKLVNNKAKCVSCYK
jgi:hypothetical protein